MAFPPGRSGWATTNCKTFIMTYYSTPEGKDPQLWNMARKRASFKSHLVTYLIVNAGLWAIWFFTGASTYGTSIPWPAWSMFGWGIGLVSHYASAYNNQGFSPVKRKYDNLTHHQSK